MIDTFSMMKRVISRLEKFTFDRVWNEPYAEYRTNTRPKILNHAISVSLGNDLTGQEYQPVAGVLSGEFEQIALPSSDMYYVYTIEKEQFRPIKLQASTWVALSEYCNLNRTEIRVYSDTGVFLWRGGIYIRQSDDDEQILLAVDATMLHRCLDTYTTQEGGSLVVTKRADPTCIYFTKYVDTDSSTVETKQGTFSRLNEGDNVITCSKLTASDAALIRRGAIQAIPGNSSIAFYNGHVFLSTSDYASQLTRGGYVESIYDADIVYDGYMERWSDKLPTYLCNGHRRVLFHIPRAINSSNWLITYNSCDIYIIPKTLTEAKTAGGYDPLLAGVIVHMCDRAENFHQLTHNDFSVDLDLLDSVAAENGFEENSYYIHFVVRHHSKKLGVVRDACYCDILYATRHTDEDIIAILTEDPAYAQYNLGFWSAAYLEQNSMYAKAMIQRVGPTVKKTGGNSIYYRPTVDRYYKAGKTYYYLNASSTWEPVEAIPGSPIPEGVVEFVQGAVAQDPLSFAAGNHIESYALERMRATGYKVTAYDQCSYCKLYNVCERRKADGRGENGKLQSTICPDFAYRGIDEFVAIYGYYNTLQLVCRRVTTYKVTVGRELNKEPEQWSPSETTMEDDPSVVICNPTYSETELSFPVRIPLALFDLDYDEWLPLVYVNGVKLDSAKVTITGKVTTDPSGLGLVESFWAYTPGFDDDIFFDTDQEKLNVKVIDPDVEIKAGDYVTIELIPNPHTDSEAPVDTGRADFDLSETEDTATSMAFVPLGSNLVIERKNSELVYLNGKQLVSGIDYMPYKTYTAADFKPIVQNVSYLVETDNLIEAITLSDAVIGSTKGFVLGNEINWDGVAPFWFDNMSILSVGGKVVSNFEYENSRLVLADGTHENGEPYMVRTSVPQSVIDMISNSEARTSDDARLSTIRNYFDLISTALPYRAVIPYSHKVYSTYLLKIITDILDGVFDFEMLEDDEEFLAQFSAYEQYKDYDVVYNRENGVTANDLRFLDIYPIYHNLVIGSSHWRRKITYLMNKLLPTDEIRHREHVNGN